MPDAITIDIATRTEPFNVGIEEYNPYEPSNYCYDAGWTCYDEVTDTEYFVSESGLVYADPSDKNVMVGFAPVIKEAADRLEAQLAEAYSE